MVCELIACFCLAILASDPQELIEQPQSRETIQMARMLLAILVPVTVVQSLFTAVGFIGIIRLSLPHLNTYFFIIIATTVCEFIANILRYIETSLFVNVLALLIMYLLMKELTKGLNDSQEDDVEDLEARQVACPSEFISTDTSDLSEVKSSDESILEWR